MSFHDKILSVDRKFLKRAELEVLQVNMGNLCNQACSHCHIGGSPRGDRAMSKETVDDIVRFLSRTDGLTLDITGGCPELNSHFRYLVEKAKPHVRQILVRNNLTVIHEKGMDGLPRFYAKNGIKLISSLPCYTKENVDKQRGEGVYLKSIEALKILNGMGYGAGRGLELDLVYNPGGAFLPGEQAELEEAYKKILYEEQGIVFDHLLAITNAPINRFEQCLKTSGNYNDYMKLIIDNFNPGIAGNIMCRNLLNVGYDGTLYDCDFNQALNLPLQDENSSPMTIGTLKPEDLKNKEIIFEDHCYCCTAGAGSSCRGALK